MRWAPVLGVVCGIIASLQNIKEGNYESAFWAGSSALWASILLIPEL